MDYSLLDRDSIVEFADQNEGRFSELIGQGNYDSKGMWFSEIVQFLVCCEMADCDRIVESGRARGVSTKLLSLYFEGTDVEIISIDYRPGSEDDKIAQDRLKNADNVTLKYGDAREIANEFVNEDSGVLVDGPKGDGALRLGIHLLRDRNVPFVAIHDLHKESFHRDLSELIFNHRLFTDHRKLVKGFKHFDQEVAEWNREVHSEDEMFGPYVKDGEESRSYGPTLGFFFNEDIPVDPRIGENYLKYLDDEEGLVSSLVEQLRKKQITGGPIERQTAATVLKFGRTVLD